MWRIEVTIEEITIGHVDINHKEEARLKIINSIRSVLHHNKHGLLMEAFEREFRDDGEAGPIQTVRVQFYMTLLTNMPDVVTVTLAGGQTTACCPVKATEHC